MGLCCNNTKEEEEGRKREGAGVKLAVEGRGRIPYLYSQTSRRRKESTTWTHLPQSGLVFLPLFLSSSIDHARCSNKPCHQWIKMIRVMHYVLSRRGAHKHCYGIKVSRHGALLQFFSLKSSPAVFAVKLKKLLLLPLASFEVQVHFS